MKAKSKHTNKNNKILYCPKTVLEIQEKGIVPQESVHTNGHMMVKDCARC